MLSNRKSLICDHAKIISPQLLPEIQLYLAADDLPIWRMGEDELKEIGMTTPFWAFAWAGGQALARYLLDNQDLVRDKRVLDFGSGSGMVAIAALMAGAKSVLATDIDLMACAAMELNAEINNVKFDISNEDVIGQTKGWDLVLVGDVCYDKRIADLVIPWVKEIAATGTPVLVGDPGRFYLPKLGLQQIAKYSASTTSLMEDSDLRNAQVWTVAD